MRSTSDHFIPWVISILSYVLNLTPSYSSDLIAYSSDLIAYLCPPCLLPPAICVLVFSPSVPWKFQVLVMLTLLSTPECTSFSSFHSYFFLSFKSQLKYSKQSFLDLDLKYPPRFSPLHTIQLFILINIYDIFVCLIAVCLLHLVVSSTRTENLFSLFQRCSFCLEQCLVHNSH